MIYGRFRNDLSATAGSVKNGEHRVTGFMLCTYEASFQSKIVHFSRFVDLKNSLTANFFLDLCIWCGHRMALCCDENRTVTKSFSAAPE
jgi:hypothetical protein